MTRGLSTGANAVLRAVLLDRRAALAFLAEEYGDEAPKPGLEWQLVSREESVIREETPARVVYRFAAGDWAMTVAYPIGSSGPIIYSVELGNPQTGFHWEGGLDGTGQVTD